MLAQRWSGFFLPTLASVVFLVAFLISSQSRPEYDLWWHLRDGEHIAATHALPRTDTYSHTAYGTPRIIYSWLSALTFYEVWRSAGMEGLNLLRATLTALTMLVMALCLQRCAGSVLARALTLLAGAPLLLGRCETRPYLFSYLFIAICCWSLYGLRSRSGWRFWGLIPLMALWCNMHGEFAQALAFVFILAAGHWAEARLSPPGPERLCEAVAAARLFVLGALMALAAGLANPYGWKLYQYVLGYAGPESSYMKSFVNEWNPADLLHNGFLTVYLILLAGAVAFSRLRKDIGELLLCLFYVVMALRYSRLSVCLALATMPILARHLEDASSRIAGLREPDRALMDFESRARPWLLTAGMWLGVCLLPFVFGRAVWVQKWFGERAQDIQSAGASFLAQSDVPGEMFNEYNAGGYYLWMLRGMPQRKVFIDGRCDMYGDRWLKESDKIVFAQEGWEKALDEHRVNLAILYENRPLTPVLRGLKDKWREVRRGSDFAIFRRFGKCAAGSVCGEGAGQAAAGQASRR